MFVIFGIIGAYICYKQAKKKGYKVKTAVIIGGLTGLIGAIIYYYLPDTNEISV